MIRFNKTNYTTADYDDILDTLIANNQYSGELQIRSSQTIAPDTTKLDILRTRGWVVDGSSGGGVVDPLAGVANFTNVVYSIINGLQYLTFSGGNLIGATEYNINDFGPDVYNTMAEGVSIVQIGASLGTHYVKWRRFKNGARTAWTTPVAFTVTNTGAFEVILVDAVTNNDNKIQFPVYVATISNVPGGVDTKVNSGQIANDENEFITIWNTLNSAYCVLTEGNYKIYSPTIQRWEFKGLAVDFKQPASAAWCYPI